MDDPLLYRRHLLNRIHTINADLLAPHIEQRRNITAIHIRARIQQAASCNLQDGRRNALVPEYGSGVVVTRRITVV